MADESIQERQSNELEALKAIFGEQLQESTTSLDGWRPLDFVLTVEPQQGSVLQEVHTCVDLHFICSDNYPNDVPKMTVVKSKGLTKQQIEALLHNLCLQAERLRGEVMVFELATFVQSFLHQYNRPGFPSLYDEMFSRQQKKQQKEDEQKKVLEDKTRQEVLLEIQNKRIALKQELRWGKNSDIAIKDESDFLPRSDVLFHPIQQPTIKRPMLTADLLDSADSNDMKLNDSAPEDFSPWMAPLKGVSRLENEFEILQFVGKGAFGDVLKVRNKLDLCLYAIKRIELSPMNKPLYKKITREVKLLSRLNHENVVRYFNSWIETIIPVDNSTPSLSQKSEKLEYKVMDMLPCNDLSLDWDLSKQDNSESSNDSSDDNCWITFVPGLTETETSSEDVVDSPQQSYERGSSEGDSFSLTSATHQFMYIQMEFCEKSTLRTAIDNGLYTDEKRVLRLLREIVEGLSHIHQQGIIHRDLKPVNVFIDSEDHVKIGDFGLATTNVLHKAGVVVEVGAQWPSVADNSHTGQVGTALYVAPELNSPAPKATYNQKVDIYSLGVMFFEMCYRPLLTHMERMKVLADLRSEDCVLPPDFLDNSKLTKTKLLRWMLTHDSVSRPSSAELLQSELLPPPQFEECELQELLRYTLHNPQSKLYKYLMASCFSQKMTTAQDVTYDMSVSKGRWFVSLLEEVVVKLRKVLQSHGAVSLSSPLLTPCGVSPLPPSSVAVMTRGGNVAVLPHDLRLPFARFLAHNPSLTQLKRYCIDRVYRERRVLGHHPRELYECAFDIVTPTSGIVMAESELLAFVWRALNEFPSLAHNNCVIRLNHTSLLRAVFLHCGIEATRHNCVCSLLAQAKEENYSKVQSEGLLSGLGLSEHTVSTLFSLLDLEQCYTRAYSSLQPILRRNTATDTLCKQAFHHLQQVINNAEELGVKCEMVVTPGLVENLSHFSGLLCHVVWEQRSKQGRSQRTVIARGGRYDNLIINFRQMHEEKESGSSQSAAGISLSVDKLVNRLQADQLKLSPVDVVVCGVGNKLITRDKLRLTHNLWASGIKTYLLDSLQNLEEIQNFCLEMNIPHIIMLKEADPGSVRIRSWNKDRFLEKKLGQGECVEHMLRLCQSGDSIIPKPETKTTQVMTEMPVINIVFLIGEKLSSTMKRRYESQVLNSILSTAQRLSAKVRVEVIVVNLEAEVIRMLASYIEPESEDHDLLAVVKRFPRHKKAIYRLSEQIQGMTNNHNNATIVLYSIIDNMFKVLL